MKKIVSVLTAILILLTVFTAVASAADEKNTFVFEKDGNEITVEFESGKFSEEKQEAIAKRLAGIEDDSATTYGLLCNIIGHNIETETTNVITHKVFNYDPRCKKQTYYISTCTRCDYYEEELITSGYVSCCPED